MGDRPIRRRAAGVDAPRGRVRSPDDGRRATHLPPDAQRRPRSCGDRRDDRSGDRVGDAARHRPPCGDDRGGCGIGRRTHAGPRSGHSPDVDRARGHRRGARARAGSRRSHDRRARRAGRDARGHRVGRGEHRRRRRRSALLGGCGGCSGCAGAPCCQHARRDGRPSLRALRTGSDGPQRGRTTSPITSPRGSPRWRWPCSSRTEPCRWLGRSRGMPVRIPHRTVV